MTVIGAPPLRSSTTEPTAMLSRLNVATLSLTVILAGIFVHCYDVVVSRARFVNAPACKSPMLTGVASLGTVAAGSLRHCSVVRKGFAHQVFQKAPASSQAVPPYPAASFL